MALPGSSCEPTMVFSFARVGAALAVMVEDVYVQNRRLWVQLHKKGGKLHILIEEGGSLAAAPRYEQRSA